MSHSRPSVDTQTLLQSMLQRLRLQPGLETQHGRQGQAPHSPTTATQGQGEDGRRPGANVIGNGAVVLSLADDVRGAEGKGGCEKARKEFGIPAWDCNFGGSSRKGEEGRKQPTGSLPKLDRGQMVSSPSAAQGAPVLGPSSSVKRGDPGVSAGALPTVMTFTETQTGNEGHIDPSPLGNSSLSSKTKGAQNHARSLLMTSNSDFTPRVYDWSLKSTELYPDMGSQMERWRPLGNGGSEVLGHGDVMEIMSPSQGVAENTSSTKTMKRLSENTTQRWTQRIKEKWKDRQGSFGKKRKAEDGVREGRKDAKQVKFPRQHQLSTGEDNVTKMSNKEGEMTTQSPIKESQGEAPPTLSEDSGTEGQFRSPSSFEFSLGSFSLLEEILTGQEWARFLNPSQVDTSANQTLAEEVTNQPETSQSRPQDNDSIQSTLTLDRVSQSGNVNSQWNFRPSELDQSYDRSADVSSPVNMNINEPSLDQEQNSKCELIQSAPKEYGHVQSQTSSDEVKPNHIPVLEISFIKPVEVLDSSALKSRVHLSRKRMHQSQERKEERECLKGEVGGRKQDSVPSDEGEEEREEGDNIMMPLYPLKSSLSPLPPSSPSSSSTSHPLVFRSILRHSMSQDSKCSLSMETVTKKRRMSNSHHVRFSEEVVTMPPSLLIPQDSDSEEDCETEEDSTLEEDAVMKEEVKVVPMMPQPAAALPAWIIALRRKTRKKHRH